MMKPRNTTAITIAKTASAVGREGTTVAMMLPAITMRMTIAIIVATIPLPGLELKTQTGGPGHF
jgi:hypothetical protein